MRRSMSWNDTVRTAGLAALDERTAAASRAPIDLPFHRDPHDAWLSRVQPPLERAALPSRSHPTTRR